MGFLDVKKAFDTVWHEGLLLKLCQFGFPRYIWILIHNWYRGSSSAELWNSKTSRYFPVKQGVRQGAILSPLLYSIFVNDLLHLLSSSGHGVSIGGIFCGSPMYADDLALIAESSAALQSMFDLVHNFSIQWHYQLNALKSAVLVFGESASFRSRYRPQRQWHIGSAVIQERDSYHHLGVLRSVSTSSISRTSERCSSCRSVFYSLNALGSRAGCLHPLTSLRLYKSYCLPILLYGCELWSLTQTELTLLERTHRKILRTISGMPIRCKSLALQQSLGTISIRSLIHQRQLNFIHSFTSLPPDSLPSVIFVKRMAGPFSPRSSLTIFHSLVDTYKLPSIPSVLSNHLSRSQWKSLIKRCLLASEFSSYVTECAHLPLSDYPPSRLGKPYPHWLVTLGFPNISRKNISRMRVLFNCGGLESDICRFRPSSPSPSPPSAICKLCNLAPEDAFHFIAQCPALSPARDAFDLPTPLASARDSDPAHFSALILGTEWFDDTAVQHACTEYIHHLLSARSLLLSPSSAHT